MSRPLQKLQRFFRELKRRNVYRVAVAYLAVAFVGFQAAKLLIPSTVLPAWTDEFFLFLLIIGFPVALVVAWAFELTPEGVRRTTEGEPGEPESEAGTRIAYKVLVGIGLAAAAVAGGWYLTGGGESDTERRLGDRSIAVLPFDELGEAEPGVFTAGMHDDLLARLSNVSDLEVISRTAVQQFRDTELTIRQIADSLGVRWVLEGGVQEMGDEIQVNAQLIDPRTETHAWVESYRRDLTAQNLFDLQGEITKQIARSLEAELSPGEQEQVERRPTGNLQAYQLYVQGRRHLRRMAWDRALESFHSAIKQDSSYALAWAGLANTMARVVGSSFAFPDSLLYPSEEAARQALEINSELAEAHASLALISFNDQEGPTALRHLNRALELKPSYAEGHYFKGALLAILGRPNEALKHQRQAVRLNPLAYDYRDALARAYLVNGQYEKALAQARRAQEIEPGHLTSNSLAVALLHMGQGDFEFTEVGYGFPESSAAGLGMRVLARVLRGDTMQARALLERLGGKAEPWDRAHAHAALGEIDAAFAALWRVDWSKWAAVRAPELRFLYPQSLGRIRDDPRYNQLIRRVNQALGLNPDGSLPDSVDVSFGSETESGS